MTRASGTRLGWVVVAFAVVSITGCAIPRWPVEGRLTSAYGLRFRGASPDIHRGVDISVPEGTPVKAMKDGRVRFTGVMDGFGKVIWLEHGGDILTVYAHLSRVLVSEGERVRGEQVIAESGSTGNVTAAHLHFEVWRNGREVDPVQMLGGPPPGN